jgi:hypothetical protein
MTEENSQFGGLSTGSPVRILAKNLIGILTEDSFFDSVPVLAFGARRLHSFVWIRPQVSLLQFYGIRAVANQIPHPSRYS